MKPKEQAIIELLRVKRCERDIIYFAETYLKHLLKSKTPEFHKEIYALLRETRLAVAAPRGFAKSTIVQKIYGLWLILTQKNVDVLTISASGSLATEWVIWMRNELETNDLLRNDFDYLVWGDQKSQKWTETHITIDTMEGKILNQLRAKGRGCQVRGFRPTHVLCDDLEDDDQVRSSEQREKLKEWFLGALLNTLTLDQQLIVIGTILHPLALLNDIIARKKEFKGWTTKKYKALVDGKSIWKERWPTKKLFERKAEIGTYKFEAEFQNNPMASTHQLIKNEWIKTWKKLPKDLTKYLIIDPAISQKEEADETGMVILGIDEEKDIYEVESRAGKWGIWEIRDNLLDLYKKHNPVKIGIEAIAYQQVLKPIFLKEGKERGFYLPIQQITLGSYSGTQKKRKEPKDKFTRAMGITHMFENGWVFLKSQKLIDQTILFPTGDKDDLFDAMVYGLHMIMKYSKKTAIFKDKSERLRQKVTSFEVKDKQMPCLAPPPGKYRVGGRDWRTLW